MKKFLDVVIVFVFMIMSFGISEASVNSVTIQSPVDGFVTAEPNGTVSGYIVHDDGDIVTVTLTVNSVDASVIVWLRTTNKTYWRTTITLEVYLNTIVAESEGVTDSITIHCSSCLSLEDWYEDADGDGYPDGTTITQPTDPGDDYYLASELTSTSIDCNDNNGSVHPGANDICGDGIDQDCSGSDAICPPEDRTWYKDSDGDRYSDGTTITQPIDPGDDYYLASELTSTSIDCNDNNGSVHPGANDICGDGIDQDCSGSDAICPPSNPEIEITYPEESGSTVMTSFITVRGTASGVDKLEIKVGGGDWKNVTVSAAWSETVSLSPDFNTIIVRGGKYSGQYIQWLISKYTTISYTTAIPVVWYKDKDRDGYSDGSNIISSIRPSNFYKSEELIVTSGDCNDNNPAIHPNATEICGDGVDQNCDGKDKICPPQNLIVLYLDADGDEFGGDSSISVDADSTFPPSYVQNNLDCDDSDDSIHPDAEEICGDDIDQNCNGSDFICPPEEPNPGDGDNGGDDPDVPGEPENPIMVDPINYQQGQDLAITAMIDDDNVASVVLYYRIVGAAEYSLLSMTSYNGQWTATVPSADITENGMEYYISAVDANGDILYITDPIQVGGQNVPTVGEWGIILMCILVLAGFYYNEERFTLA